MISNLLLALPLVVLLGIPAYIFFRERMVHTPHLPSAHTRKRVLRLTATNLILNSLATLYFFTLFVLVMTKIMDNAAINNLLLAIGFMLVVGITYYGNGIYITSIVLEDYTLPELRSITHFKTQFVATHLFHGPISHILIYSGWLLIFFVLALIDISGKPEVNLSSQTWLILGGAVTGAAYAGAQIYNGTAPYQFWTGFWATLVFVIRSSTLSVSLFYYPLGLFFLALIFLFELTLLGYFTFIWARGQKINWDKSGY